MVDSYLGLLGTRFPEVFFIPLNLSQNCLDILSGMQNSPPKEVVNTVKHTISQIWFGKNFVCFQPAKRDL